LNIKSFKIKIISSFVFFGESLSVGGTAIDTNTLKKMTSSSIAVTNDGSVTQRLILITR